jgi:hypothetical protein
MHRATARRDRRAPSCDPTVRTGNRLRVRDAERARIKARMVQCGGMSKAAAGRRIAGARNSSATFQVVLDRKLGRAWNGMNCASLKTRIVRCAGMTCAQTDPETVADPTGLDSIQLDQDGNAGQTLNQARGPSHGAN